METELKQVQLDNTKEIELPRLDVSPYVGKKTKIASVREYEGRYGYFIKAETDVLGTAEMGGDHIELRASRVFGLHKDKDSNVGWAKDTKLGLFLKKMNVAHYNDLVGKEVQVQKQTSKEGQEFLTFD